MITDDPGTPGDGHWETNIAATGRHGAFGSEKELPLLDINYGLGARIQIKYELPWVWLRKSDDGSRSGLGNSLIGIRLRFYDAGETGWQVSTYPQVEFRNPGSDSVQRGLAENGTGVFLPFEIQRAFGPVSVNVEAGREFRSRGEDEWVGGIVIGDKWAQYLKGMAELHARASESFERSTLAVNVGARIDITRRGVLLVSIGSALHNALDGRASQFGYVELKSTGTSGDRW